jgi:hypothetical protein
MRNFWLVRGVLLKYANEIGARLNFRFQQAPSSEVPISAAIINSFLLRNLLSGPTSPVGVGSLRSQKFFTDSSSMQDSELSGKP